MRKYILILLVLTLPVLISTGRSNAQEENTLVSKPAIDFTLPDLKNNNFSLSNYKNKQPVILLFWTTWCPYCRQELKKLDQLTPRFSKDGWELLAINVGESISKVTNFAKRSKLYFNILLDKDTTVADSYSLLGVPTYIFIDKGGRIILEEHFFSEEDYKKLKP